MGSIIRDHMILYTPSFLHVHPPLPSLLPNPYTYMLPPLFNSGAGVLTAMLGAEEGSRGMYSGASLAVITSLRENRDQLKRRHSFPPPLLPSPFHQHLQLLCTTIGKVTQSTNHASCRRGILAQHVQLLDCQTKPIGCELRQM